MHKEKQFISLQSSIYYTRHFFFKLSTKVFLFKKCFQRNQGTFFIKKTVVIAATILKKFTLFQYLKLERFNFLGKKKQTPHRRNFLNLSFNLKDKL